ncbi:MAG: glucosyltransferase domain-containing protein [Clostridia bacterium]|nr:glucosyltransferase domain-containing protein [Clostridia bacterium]
MAGVVVLPENVLKKLNTYILPQWKVCFFTAFLVGLMAHLYKITNWLPNWDSLVFRYDSQNMVALGRWFLPVVCSVSSFYDLPFLNGIIAIVFHALGAVCICRMFDVQKKITAGLIGAVIVSFPTVTSVMMYNYVADGYSIAFFLSVLAAFWMTKEKPKFLLSSVLIALSAGIYQAYITVTIMLILLKLIDEIVYHNASFRNLLKKVLHMIFSGILGVALYGIILKDLLGILSVKLLDYQGMGETASLSNIDLIASLYVVKETFVKCFFDVSGGVNVYVALNYFVLIFTLVYYFKCIVKIRIYKNPANTVMIGILSVMLVFGAGVLAFVNPVVDYHNLMLMGYSVFYLFFLLIYEREEESEKYSSVKCWIVLITAITIISNQIVISNVSYHKAQMAYEKSYGVLVRIADRIEQTPGSEACKRILVIGALDDSEAYSVNLTPDITGITDGYIVRADDETVGQSVLTSSLNDYCGKNYEFVSGEEKKNFIQREEIKSMKKWPQKDCVAVVDDTIVIKLGTEGEN